MKSLKAPGLPENFACLALCRGDLLGKPGPSEHFSVSPLSLKSEESCFFFFFLLHGFLAHRFYRRTLENVLLWGKMDLAAVPPRVAWWEAVAALQTGHGLWPLVCSAQAIDDWKHLIFLPCKWFKTRHRWNEAVTKLPTSRTGRFPPAHIPPQ